MDKKSPNMIYELTNYYKHKKLAYLKFFHTELAKNESSQQLYGKNKRLKNNLKLHSTTKITK